MKESLKIGIIGDFDQGRQSQTKTSEALDHVSNKLAISIDAVCLPTTSLGNQAIDSVLKEFHALWAGPGDYANPAGAIDAIKFCREQQWPFIGT
ncbi:hypothetical protein ACFLZM_06625 [Thermodesulfobacteriota bacterium]